MTGKWKWPRWVSPRWTDHQPAGRMVLMGKATEPDMPYEARHEGYWCRVVEHTLDTEGKPIPDMRRVEFANGERWTVMLGQLDWKSGRSPLRDRGCAPR